MTSNPLPPGKRQPGSVGIGQGVEVQILDQEGKEVSQGSEDEICIRGENVTKGYINNPGANKSSFTKVASSERVIRARRIRMDMCLSLAGSRS
jgi:long-subunit acyl-CoA synthetase (AMP-forming)